jgi:hypothetical protein
MSYAVPIPVRQHGTALRQGQMKIENGKRKMESLGTGKFFFFIANLHSQFSFAFFLRRRVLANCHLITGEGPS